MAYVDQTRYPKIVTKGYEKDFKEKYSLTLQLMVKDLSKKMLNNSNNK